MTWLAVAVAAWAAVFLWLGWEIKNAPTIDDDYEEERAEFLEWRIENLKKAMGGRLGKEPSRSREMQNALMMLESELKQLRKRA